MKLVEILNIYDLHDEPKSLAHHDAAHESIPELAWEKCIKAGDGDHDQTEWDIDVAKFKSELIKHEKVWLTNVEYAYKYASYLRANHHRERIKAVEKVILDSNIKDAWITSYALNVIKGRWPEAEKKIATDAWASWDYANIVLNDRFKLGEPTVAKSQYAYSYASRIIKGRWREAEKYAKENNLATIDRAKYAKNCLKLKGDELEAVENGAPFPP